MLINFPYIERDSPVHRLNVRSKLLLLLAFSFAIAQTSNFWVILVGLLAAAYYYRQAHITWQETKRAWYFILILNTMIVLGNFFLTGGHVVRGVDVANPEHVLFTVPFIGFTSHSFGIVALPFSVENVTFLLTQAMRNFSIAFIAVPLPYTTNPGHMAVGFKGLGLPDGVAYAIDLSFRFLPSVGRDFGTTLDAQRARGFELDKLRGGIFGKIVRLAPLVVPLVIGSIVGAEDIINAMELRCFGVVKRTWLTVLHTGRSDKLVTTLSIAWFVGITALNIIGSYTSGPLHFLHTQGIPALLL